MSMHFQNSKLRFKTFPAYTWTMKVAARLIMTHLRNVLLKLSWKASFQDSYRFQGCSVSCSVEFEGVRKGKELDWRRKAIRRREDHRLGACSSRKVLNLGARKRHFPPYRRDILIYTEVNVNDKNIFYPSLVLSLRYSVHGKKVKQWRHHVCVSPRL